jgi:hypothetical protein
VQRLLQPGFHGVHQRATAFCANGAALVRRAPANFALDGIQRANPFERLACQGSLVQLVQVHELSSNVRPARRFKHAAAVINLGIARIPVGLENAGDVLEMPLRMLAFAVGGRGKPDRRCGLETAARN